MSSRKFNNSLFFVTTLLLIVTGCTTTPESLQRISYVSAVDHSERNFLLYLPKTYGDEPDKKWPVLLFLHGHGERGNGTTELDYAMIHGPLYEAWIQKRDLPFIILVPQLPMFGMDTITSYLKDRTPDQIPKRLVSGTPQRKARPSINIPMQGSPSEANYPYENYGPVWGWEVVERDVMHMIKHVEQAYQADPSRIYLTGLSYGGFGTWYMASKHPEVFAAIAPIVGWGHIDLMPSIAQHKIPVWCFAGGRDRVIEEKYFYPGLNALEELGHPEVRFTIEADMGHGVWKRIYAGQDVYQWLLSHQKK